MRQGVVLVVSLEKVEREIDELEARGETTYSLCERLAWLYVVRDHLRPEVRVSETQALSGSEFLEAASGVSYPALMKVLDEHMNAIRVIYPKEYESVVAKVRAL